MSCSGPACKGPVEEGQDPHLTHLHHSQRSFTTSHKLKDDIFLSRSKWAGFSFFFFFLISRSRELFTKTERSFAYFKMRFFARFKRALAFTVPQNIVSIQMKFSEGIINLMLQELCQLLTAGRRPRR